MIEVLLTVPFREFDRERFLGIENTNVIWNPNPSTEELEKAEVVIGMPDVEILKKAKNMKWFQTTNAGVDNYTSHPELFENGLVFTNLSGAFGHSMSEFALTMTLMLYKHLHLYRDHQAKHEWIDEGRQDTPVGKTVLILGTGNIGTRTARLFKAFDCHIIGMRRTSKEVPEYFDEIILPDELDRTLGIADVVIGALPGTPETKYMFDERRLGLLKKSAILVNVGRGNLIDNLALAKVLDAGEIYGAALDVTDPEPLPPDHPLWDCKNVIITPHITGGSFGHLTSTEETLFNICVGNLKRYVKGEKLQNIVDIKSGYRGTEERFSDLK